MGGAAADMLWGAQGHPVASGALSAEMLVSAWEEEIHDALSDLLEQAK